MTADIEFQCRFVAGSVWRLLEMQDRNPLSPSHGLFHYAYWRDKTSEFADARFQEAGSALALLSLPAFDDFRECGELPDSETCYAGFSAALRGWSSIQHPEGCFDEWYLGERGFAATEFTMIAYGLADRLAGEMIVDSDRELLRETMDRAARWLQFRHDTVKANHEAAAGAALALAWAATGREAYRHAAREKIENVLARQQPEGWFSEIGGMDLGYCSVLLDYVMLYEWVTGDDFARQSMVDLFDFMLPHLHPDFTICAEAGLCLNPYVARLGTHLLAQHHPAAAAAVSLLQAESNGLDGLRPILADDLRLCRWSYLPLATRLIADPGVVSDPDPLALSRFLPPGWTWRADSALAAWHDSRRHVYFSPAGGGTVRIYQDRKLIIEDLGPRISSPDGDWGCLGYDPTRVVQHINGSESGFRMVGEFGRASFFFPSFLARLVLRLGSTTALGSKLLRDYIDRVRLRKRTAVNQSSAPMAAGNSPFGFERSVTVSNGGITIEDRVSALNLEVANHLTAICRHNGVENKYFDGVMTATPIILRKHLAFDDLTLAVSIQSEPSGS